MDFEKIKGLCREDYTYPGEENAFAALKKIPILDQVTAAYLKYAAQAVTMPQVQGDFCRITKDTCPDVYAVYRKALGRLDIREEYPLFSKACFEYNAYTAGGSAPYIVIHSSVARDWPEEEMLFILGHELGHIKSGHLIYYMMARGLAGLLAGVPMLGNAVFSAGIHLALTDWQRMQEFTADRAGAIAAGSVDKAIRGLGMFLGTSERIPFVKFGIEDLKRQNDSFEESSKDIASRIFCMIQIMNSTHPWTISRIKELERWKQSGGYDKVMEKCGIK